MHVEPMKYHGPGWTVDVNGDRQVTYMLWAPQTQQDQDRAGSPNPPRTDWAANWTRDGHERTGGHQQGATAEQALACFPTDTDGRAATALLLAAAGQR